MVKFRFSVVFLCVILPPCLYVLSILFLEDYAGKKLDQKLNATYLGDTRLLLNGTLPLHKAIANNLQRALRSSPWLRWGGKASVTVQTRRNTLLYPLIENDQSPVSEQSPLPIEIATENFNLLNEGLELSLVFELPHNTPITNSILGLFVFLSMGILGIYYRHWNTIYQQEMAQKTAELERLAHKENEYRRELEHLQQDHGSMAENIAKLKTELDKEKHKADTNEEEMLEEIIVLEEEINRKEELQIRQNQHIEELQAKLNELEMLQQKADNKKRKNIDIARKRLTTLYKNLVIHDRAINGYVDLSDDLKLKCEELISQINENPSSIQIKRKVFNKNNRIAVLEVVFSYKGRLYFIPKGEKQAELLTIGTKNSQQQDLAYLERL